MNPKYICFTNQQNYTKQRFSKTFNNDELVVLINLTLKNKIIGLK